MDSDNEIEDKNIMGAIENKDLDEFEDVNDLDKEFFKMWNDFSRTFQ